MPSAAVSAKAQRSLSVSPSPASAVPAGSGRRVESVPELHEEHGGDIALAGAGMHGDDGLPHVLGALRHLHRRPGVGAGRDPRRESPPIHTITQCGVGPRRLQWGRSARTIAVGARWRGPCHTVASGRGAGPMRSPGDSGLWHGWISPGTAQRSDPSPAAPLRRPGRARSRSAP